MAKNSAYQDWYEKEQEELRDYASGGMGGFTDTTDRLDLSPEMLRWAFQELPVSQLLLIRSEADWRDWYENEKRARRNEDGDDNYFDGLEQEWGQEPSPIGPIVVARVGKSLDIGDGWHRAAIAVTKRWATVPAVVGTLKKMISKETSMTLRTPTRNQSRRGAPARQDLTAQAEAAGEQYAYDQLQGDYFMDWVREQLLEASKMPPDKVLPLETKDDALVIAKNMLRQLEQDTRRGLDTLSVLELIGPGTPKRWRAHGMNPIDDFYKGFDRALDVSLDWLADELLEIKGEMGKGDVVEDRRRGYHENKSIRVGSAVMVINPDSMYRSERGTVVELDARRAAKLDNFNRERVRKGAVLVERSNGSLFVVDSRDLAFYTPASGTREMRSPRRRQQAPILPHGSRDGFYAPEDATEWAKSVAPEGAEIVVTKTPSKIYPPGYYKVEW